MIETKGQKQLVHLTAMTSKDTTAAAAKTTRTLIDETISSLYEARQGFSQDEFQIAIKDALRCRDLPTDQETVASIERAVSAKDNPEDPKANIVHGGQTFTWKEVQDVMPGFFKENLLHLINAEQGAGKSTLMLGLFRALISDEQPASFLNLEVQASKNWRLFLVAPDMPRESWSTPLENYGLITGIAKGGSGEKSGTVIPEVTVACSDVPLSLSPEDILWYREMAVASVDRSERPLFVFDSYSTLVANFKDMNEIDSQFAQPLQNLQKAMAGTGATTIVLHHTAKSRSSSTASSGSGTNRLGRIPDVVIELEATSRNSKRLFMTSSKRVTPTSLIIEQDFEAGQWICHGDARQAMELRDLLQKIDGLKGPKATIYEWAQQRWEEQRKGFTTEDVRRLIERSVQAARTHVRVMEANGVIFQCDSIPTPGTHSKVFLPSEYREEWEANQRGLRNHTKPLGNLAKTTESTAAQAYESKESYERGKAGGQPPTKPCETSETLRKQIVPCHPIDTPVMVDGVNGWKVVEANLASGMHIIEKNGIRKKDLRMMDLAVYYSEEEEL